jgi:tRNA threonylcarbamoyladenosine dehydratase
VTTPELSDADLERRFSGLKRLYGEAGYQRLRSAHAVVIGVGGVGSWAAEALARCGVARLSLIDLDHVAESNIQRQVQALGSTLGMAKVQALRGRIADIHPGCAVATVEAFVEEGQWLPLLEAAGAQAADVFIDACDDGRAKRVLAQWALEERRSLIVCGAAGGKQQAQGVAVADLAETTHDPLLARLRQHLRKALPASASAAPNKRFGLRCVYSAEAVQRPPAVSESSPRSGLNCAGYGSSVTVTATFGMVAAGEAIRLLLE